MSFGKALIKAEGSAVVDSLVYKTAQLTIQEGDRSIVVAEMLLRLEYILQRTVPDYDELVKQFNAIKDIERSNNEL
jgi:hypothetical protein